jgi:SMODS-associating 2TM, beta-strand rich effector domain
MHPYTTDSNERKNITVSLTVLGVLAALALTRITQALNMQMPWYVDAPSVFGFFGLLWTGFDKWLWKLRALYHIHLIATPNINGRWEGLIISSFDGHTTQTPATVEVRQTWTGISVMLETQSSRSRSVAAMFTTESGRPTLIHEYLSEPKTGAVDTMKIHRGTARFTLEHGENGLVLNGEYYSGRGRQNFGTLHFKRSSTRAQSNM